jgi:hypothetical protein
MTVNELTDLLAVKNAKNIPHVDGDDRIGHRSVRQVDLLNLVLDFDSGFPGIDPAAFHRCRS